MSSSPRSWLHFYESNWKKWANLLLCPRGTLANEHPEQKCSHTPDKQKWKAFRDIAFWKRSQSIHHHRKNTLAPKNKVCKPSILYPEDGEQKIEDTQTQQNWVLKTIENNEATWNISDIMAMVLYLNFRITVTVDLKLVSGMIWHLLSIS